MKSTASRVVVAVIALAVLVGAGYWWFRRPSAPVAAAPSILRPVRTITLGSPATAAGTSVRSFPGRVQSARGRRVDVSFRVPGTLLELPVRTNQNVAAGQLLARLDPRDFETRVAQASSAVAEARARLAAMQAGRPEDIRILQSQLTAEQARLREAELDFTRTRNLFEKGAATKDVYDRATAAVEVARATTAAATTSLQRAQAGARAEDIEGQRALIQRLEAQEREARDALADTRLTAPFAGVVARTMAETFQEIQARQPILSLRDAAGLEIVTDVPESVMAELNHGDLKNISAVFDFLPGRSFPVTFAEIEAEADPRTRTFAAVLNMPNIKDARILPGMTATIRGETTTAAAPATGEWSIPSAAVFVDPDGKPGVWRVDPGTQTVKRVAVTAGDVRGDRVAVRGLRAGDTIVTAGANHLQEGEKVRSVSAEENRIR